MPLADTARPEGRNAAPQQCSGPAEWKQREERAIRIFRRKAHIYLPDRTVLSDDLRCLAMMQHHGAPTRLFDFTKSPYVAAFFALEQATEKTIPIRTVAICGASA